MKPCTLVFNTIGNSFYLKKLAFGGDLGVENGPDYWTVFWPNFAVCRKSCYLSFKCSSKFTWKGIKLEDEIDDISGRLAGLTPGFVGADIANICNEAAIVAARRQGETVSLDDFEKATDRIIGDLESNKIMSKEERSIVAHHMKQVTQLQGGFWNTLIH